MPCPRLFTLALLVGLVTTAAGAAELVLTPTELVLVDGRKVQGQLAAELDSHLIVYSPGLGTIKSFRKEFVASYTKDKKPVKVSAPRALTPEDLKINLDWNGWLDAAPDKGPKPAYATQKWSPPKRLMVWKSLGGQPQNGTYDSSQGKVKCMVANGADAGNWLVLGAPLDGQLWDLDTDLILPGVEEGKSYQVTAGDVSFRHVSAENHAQLLCHRMRIQGNVWIHERGRVQVTAVKEGTFVGPFHTVIFLDRPPIGELITKEWQRAWARNSNCDPEGYKIVRSGSWDFGGYQLAQYIFIKKDPGASVEFLGNIITRDKFWCFSGTTILGPDCAMMADTRNGDWVMKDATLQLMSGATWGKFQNKLNLNDQGIDGTVEFGTAERPLTKDVIVATSWKDYSGLFHESSNSGTYSGFSVAAQGKLRMHSADPTSARVVFRYLDRDGGIAWCNKRNGGHGNPFYKELNKRIDVTFLGDVEMDGVVFEDVHQGGVRLGNLGMKSKLKHVTFGKNCGSAKPDEMFALYEQGKPPLGWLVDPVVIKAMKK